jgi:serine/threonine protein phosphatase PrpC
MNSPQTELRCIALSQPGPTKKRNEDALLVDGKIHQGSIRLEQKVRLGENGPLVFAVADGMAGSPHPQMGSNLLLQLLNESFRETPASPPNLRDRLLELQYAYVERGRKMKCRGTSATLAGVVIQDKQVHVFNVGDSRVYGIRDRMIRQLSRDHTELADMIESGEIKPMTVREAPSSFLEPSSFYMADTMHELTRVHTNTIEFTSIESLLICSDGLVDVLDEEEIRIAVTTGIEGLGALTGTARKRNERDDITSIVIFS